VESVSSGSNKMSCLHHNHRHPPLGTVLSVWELNFSIGDDFCMLPVLRNTPLPHRCGNSKMSPIALVVIADLSSVLLV
jgi:hypothetical protein